MRLVTAVVDLTPDAGTRVPMGGQEGPERLTESAHGRIEANIVALGEGADTLVLVSLDTLFAGARLTERIAGACHERFGASPDQVLVLASHTHFAPMLDERKPRLGRTDIAELERWEDTIAAAIAASERAGTATHCRQGLTFSDAGVNRRLRWRAPTLMSLLGRTVGAIYMCDNPAGPKDPRVHTCVWLSEHGEPLAAFWSFACHPVSFPEKNMASADYVGVVREALRAHLGADLPVVFGPGCMGDVRPRSPRPWRTIRHLPRILAFGPTPPPFDRAEWDAWAGRLAAEVVASDQAAQAHPIEAPPVPGPMGCVPMDALFDGDSPTRDFHVKTASVPGLGRIVALSCEPVTEIRKFFSSTPDDLVLGYEGDVFGYLPTEAMIAEGGYEPYLSLPKFGLEGAFRPGLDASLAAIGCSVMGPPRNAG